MKKKTGVFDIIVFILIAFGAVLMFVPNLWMILSSLKENMEIISKTPNILPKQPTFEGYHKVFTEAPFIRWFMNSVITSVLITVGTIFSSALAGYIFGKFVFRGKALLFIIILATMMIPFQIVMIPTYLIITKLNLINNLLSLIIPSLVSAFGIFLCKQFVESIPLDLIEAARIDGASEFKTFWSLILPQITPVLSALGIFTFMGAWNNYLWPLIVLNDTEKMTVPLALVFFNSKHSVDYNVTMSAAVLIMIPVIIVFLLFQKQFIKGLSLTGLK